MGLFRGMEPADAWRLDREALKPFRDWLGEPLRHDRFRFGMDPTFVAEGRHLFSRMLGANALSGIRPEFILVKRTLYGLYRVFERLGASVVDWCCGLRLPSPSWRTGLARSGNFGIGTSTVGILLFAC
jgi:hypothetical protein